MGSTESESSSADETDSESEENNDLYHSNSDSTLKYGNGYRSTPKMSSWFYIIQNIQRSGENLDLIALIDAAAQAAKNHDDPMTALKILLLVFDSSKCNDASSPKVNEQNIQEILKTPRIKEILIDIVFQCIEAMTGKTDLQKNMSQSITDVLEIFMKLGVSNASLLCQASALFLSIQDYSTALDLSNKAFMLDPSCISAQEAFANVCCHLVERWHFVMLNDASRNRNYQKAILSSIDGQDKVTVCDVGCGTGLLSLMAGQHEKCTKVFAIEKSSVMSDVAAQVFIENLSPNNHEKIVVINKMSTEMSVPQDIPARADILVTETFDAGLFGEGILPTLCHAWEHLLSTVKKTNRSIVIPNRARLYMQAIESDDILSESRVRSSSLYNFDLDNVTICSMVGMCPSDPYTTHDLKCLPNGYTSLSNPIEFMTVDFNDPQELMRLNNGATQDYSLTVTRKGRLDALVVWFTLELLDGIGEDVCTHTDRHSCWEQAVFPVHTCRIKQDLSMDVQVGDILHVSQRVEKALHCVSLKSIERAGPDTQRKDFNTEIGAIPPFVASTLEWCKHGIYCLNTSDVVSLNNTKLQQILSHCLKWHNQREGNESKIDFIHLNNDFSPLCLEALRLGYRQAWAIVKSPLEQVLTWKLALQNGICKSNLNLVSEIEDLYEDVADVTTSDVSKDEEDCSGIQDSSASFMTQPMLKDKCIVMIDVVDWQGRMVENLCEHVHMLRESVSNYKDVRVSPYRVDVYGVLINCDDLLRRSRVVSDENTLGYNIKPFINRFSTRNHQGICLSTLPHTKLCQPFQMFSIDLEKFVRDKPLGNAECSKPSSKSIKRREVSSCDINTFDCETKKVKLSTDSSMSDDLNGLNRTRPPRPGELHTGESNDSNLQTCDLSSYPSADEECKREQACNNNVRPKLSEDAQQKCRDMSKILPSTSKEDSTANGHAVKNKDDGFEQKRDITIQITNSGTVTALVYWFHLHVIPDKTASSPHTDSVLKNTQTRCSTASTSIHQSNYEMSTRTSTTADSNKLSSPPSSTADCIKSSTILPTPVQPKEQFPTSPPTTADYLKPPTSIEYKVESSIATSTADHDCHTVKPPTFIHAHPSSCVNNPANTPNMSYSKPQKHIESATQRQHDDSTHTVVESATQKQHDNSTHSEAGAGDGLRCLNISTIDTHDPLHHWQQAAVMSHPDQVTRKVVKNEQIKLHCAMASSAFNFWIDN